uniref:Uncharacterized protein n=1 Tax=Arundo donax TaxID=35708 RepID=A0A0A9D602_ARUDO
MTTTAAYFSLPDFFLKRLFSGDSIMKGTMENGTFASAQRCL